MIRRILYYYYKTLYLNYRLDSPDKLKQHQSKLWNKLLKKTLIHSPYYREYLNKPFEQWPIINKTIMMTHFDDINTVKINKAEAFHLALQAEETRDFSSLLNGIAIGLSSGTSGQRGLFLASPRERDAWAGIILAKVLPNGFKSKESIALFLRANSPLYSTVNKSAKIQFHFFDLMQDFEEHIQRLNRLQPTILCAPASVLKWLAQQKHLLKIKPKRIFSAAEVLDSYDEKCISSAFKQPIGQIYQCTEGFLAASNAQNQLILNEEYLIIEKEWLDEHRFVPIITDLLRSSQPIIRYRLDDVLIAKPLKTALTELSSIEGRYGDICYGKQGQRLIPIFADTLRQTMATSPVAFDDYRICQQSELEFTIQVTPKSSQSVELINHLNQLFTNKHCEIPHWNWQEFAREAQGVKQRRIRSLLNFSEREKVP